MVLLLSDCESSENDITLVRTYILVNLKLVCQALELAFLTGINCLIPLHLSHLKILL